MEGNSPWLELLIWMALIFIVLNFMLIRPNKKKMEEYKKMLSEIKTGDIVIFSGGIHGKIKKIEDDVVTIEIASGVEVKVSKSAISGKI